MTTDLHRKRAAEIFDVPEEQVTPAMRKYAKLAYYVYNYNVPRSLKDIIRNERIINQAMKDKS